MNRVIRLLLGGLCFATIFCFVHVSYLIAGNGDAVEHEPAVRSSQSMGAEFKGTFHAEIENKAHAESVVTESRQDHQRAIQPELIDEDGLQEMEALIFDEE